jgi:hypothetical protein
MPSELPLQLANAKKSTKIFTRFFFNFSFDKFWPKLIEKTKKNTLGYLDKYPVHLLVIPMYICTSQSIFSHLYVVNE